ncbi:MAG: hypothetical protein QHH75_05405 [Bacillota bacterium]|nr:hypothetical protein [Bacillota bacterium]
MVSLHSECLVLVTQPLGHQLYVFVEPVKQGGVGVAQVIEPKSGSPPPSGSA